jgi:hypothetical protein
MVWEMTELPAAFIFSFSLVLIANVYYAMLRPYLLPHRMTRLERWWQHKRAEWQDVARAVDWETFVWVAVAVAGVVFVAVNAIVRGK